MYILEAKNIIKNYAHHRALDGVNIAVPKGSVFGLLGPNGAGKTSLIRIINQITAPDQGEVLLNGRPLQPKDVVHIGYLPEERGLYKKMKVGEQAVYLAQLKGLSHSDAVKQLKLWFEKFEIASWWDKKVEELSKGMQQKVQFIVTILHKPDLLIFDEPFSGFDPINANLLKREILELKENGATVIFSTHNMSSVEELCDEIALINKSKVVLSGSVHQIRKAHKTNIFSVTYEPTGSPLSGILPANFEVQNEKLLDERTHIAQIRIPGDFSSKMLLELLLPHADIHEFREVIPSMDDIFIQTVKTANNE